MRPINEIPKGIIRQSQRMKKFINIQHYDMPKKLYLKRKLLRGMIQVLVWIGLAVIYYLAFSIFFDTPIEYELKKTNRKLENQYQMLSERFDSLELILDNVVERDKNIHNMMFEADPYTDQSMQKSRLEMYDKLLAMSNTELAEVFFSKLNTADSSMKKELAQMVTLQQVMVKLDDNVNYVPAIQPINNRELNKLATSYGMRVHPFYKTMVSHQAVDFAVAENSRVFATADGVVKDVGTQAQSKGLGVLISHGNGYETFYANLNKANVRKGERVKRGDIIALSGNSGLSLAPHLHYEVRHNGMRIDPVNYFFFELGPAEYKKIKEIAMGGMQSFD